MLMPSIFSENLFDGFFDFAKPFERTFRAVQPFEAVMKTDVKEKDDAFELALDLPGYKKEDVKAQLKDGYLTIQASNEQNNDQKDEDGRYIRRERYYGSCRRSFYVGKDVTQEDIKAKFEDGTLKLTIPKKEKEALPKQEEFIAIEG